MLVNKVIIILILIEKGKCKMKISYNRLFKLLIDKNMKKTELAKKIGLSPATLARLSKNEPVSMESIIKICAFFNCKIEEVMELISDTQC